MKYIIPSFLLILFALSSNGCTVYLDKGINPKEPFPAFKQNRLLARGVNLGNALDAPQEGEWGVTLKEEYFQLIKDAGFNSVRIPVRWSAHALSDAPYTIDPSFFQRVDWAVDNALARNLSVILNIHHYVEIHENPTEHKQRYLALWQQISEHYRYYPDNLLFEFLNEPCQKLESEQWNQFIKETLRIIRQKNPYRIVVVGPTHYNNIDYLNKLKLPDEDHNIIVTCHYYRPIEFTHQGASWIGDKADGWIGIKWAGTAEEKQAVIKDFDKALNWSQNNKRPINIGEFGAYSKAEMASRVLWTEFVAREAEKRGFSWDYWEFCSGFGVYDQSKNDWNYALLKALIPSGKNLRGKKRDKI